MGILVPRPGIELTPLALEGKILTTGLPGKSLRRACLDKKYEYGFCLREMIVTLIACTEIETIHIEKRSLDLQYYRQAEETIYLK